MKRIKLEGKKFNMLLVEEYIGGGKYRCLCGCGNTTEVFGSNLERGHTTSCGCAKLKCDLSGQTFGFLKVIERTGSKARGGVKRPRWKCHCSRCDNFTEAYADVLLSGNQNSCGCLSRDRKLPDILKEDFFEGTQLSRILTITPTNANKSGVVGVNWDKSRNKWQASIRFKGHKYNLGRFDVFDDAATIRQAAEEKIFGDFLKWYEQNKQE